LIGGLVAKLHRPALELPDLVGQVRAHLPAGRPGWLVGGAVRDALLRRPIRDFDFVVAGDALAGARSVANALGAAFYPLDAERGIGRVVLARDDGRITLDISSLRGPDLLADLTGRDFTLNALAVDLARPADLIDPLHGERDLRTKLIRACSPTAIADDPLRAIRAVRLAAELRFRIDKPTLAAVRAQAHALASVSSERRRDELLRCLGGPRPAAAIRSLDLLGLLPALLPELPALHGVTQSPPHVYDVWEHTLTVLDRLMEVLAALDPVYNIDAVSDVTLGLASLRLGRHRQALGQHLAATLNSDHPVHTLLLLASLLHDVGKPATRSVEPTGRIRYFNHDQVGARLAQERLTDLRFSTEEVARIGAIVANHLRPLNLAGETAVTRRAIYRYFHQTGPAGIDVVLLALADFLGTYGDSPPPTDEWNHLLDVCAQLLSAYFETPDETIRPPVLLTGDDLLGEFGLKAGPGMGRLLAELREAQAAGEVTDREAAATWVRAYLALNPE
jgi:putative nucleotidyltransferase with HDIG domain